MISPACFRITGSGKDDDKALYDLLGTKEERKKFDTQFKKAESNFKIAIVVKDHLDLLGRVFHRFDTVPYFSETPVEQLQCLNRAAEFVQLTEKIEQRVMLLVKRLKAAYDICSGSDAFTDSERDHIHY